MSKASRILEGLNQYVNSDKVYKPVTDTKKILLPGVYEVKESMEGIFFEKTNINTDALIKMNQAKYNYLIEEINKFWESTDKFKEMEMMNKRAFMLYSIPGTGKSCILKQVMAQMTEDGNITFIGRDAGTLVRGLKLFREVEESRKALVILEEVDEMVDRGGSKALADLLDGPDSIADIFYLGTTNYIEKIPERLLRPSRFDRKVEIESPSREDRFEYFKAKMKGKAADEVVSEYVEVTDGFTFADMKEFLVSVVCLGNDLKETVTRLKGFKTTVRETSKYRGYDDCSTLVAARSFHEALSIKSTISEDKYSGITYIKYREKDNTAHFYISNKNVHPKFSKPMSKQEAMELAKKLGIPFDHFYHFESRESPEDGNDEPKSGDKVNYLLRGKKCTVSHYQGGNVILKTPQGHSYPNITISTSSKEWKEILDDWRKSNESNEEASMVITISPGAADALKKSITDAQKWLEDISGEADVKANPELNTFHVDGEGADLFKDKLLDGIKANPESKMWVNDKQVLDKPIDNPPAKEEPKKDTSAEIVKKNQPKANDTESVEASELGWTPGKWAQVANFKDTQYIKKETHRAVDGDIEYVLYVSKDGKKLMIFNEGLEDVLKKTMKPGEVWQDKSGNFWAKNKKSMEIKKFDSKPEASEFVNEGKPMFTSEQDLFVKGGEDEAGGLEASLYEYRGIKVATRSDEDGNGYWAAVAKSDMKVLNTLSFTIDPDSKEFENVQDEARGARIGTVKRRKSGGRYLKRSTGWVKIGDDKNKSEGAMSSWLIDFEDELDKLGFSYSKLDLNRVNGLLVMSPADAAKKYIKEYDMSHKRCEGQHGECPECGNDLDPDVICKKCKEHTEYCPECGTACCSAGKVDYGDYNDRDESKVDKLLGLCTEMARHDYTGVGDVKGSNVSDKDVMRLEDIKDKANGDEGKVLSLATRMAQLIKDPDKAMRRAKAAKLVFAGELGKKVYDIFVKAA